MPTGLPFLHSLMVLGGSLLAAAGIALWMIETGPDDGLERSRQKLGDDFRKLSEAPWSKVMGCLSGWLVIKLNGVVRATFQEADRGIAFGGLVFGLLFVFLPLAAAVNALIGGSEFLFWHFFSLLGVFIFLNFSGETKRFRMLNNLAALYLGLSLFAVIPLYVLQSFTEVTIHNTFSHAVLKSPLVAVFWYVAAYGLGLLFDTMLRFRGTAPKTSAPARFVHGFLVAVPVAYVLIFAAMLAGHLSVFDQNPARSWQIVLVGGGLAAISFPLTLKVMGSRLPALASYGLSFIIASGLAVISVFAMHAGTEAAIGWDGALSILMGLKPGGGGIYLGPDFWVSHLAFLPWVLFVFTGVFGLMTKASIRLLSTFSGPGAAFRQPFRASALSCAGGAVLTFFAAIFV